MEVQSKSRLILLIYKAEVVLRATTSGEGGNITLDSNILFLDSNSFLSASSKVSIEYLGEYLGKVQSNFEGTIQLQINQFRSSEMGYRTVAASGTCDIQARAGNLHQSYCTVSGSGIDHGKSNFKAQ
jgi:hypothetical protein